VRQRDLRLVQQRSSARGRTVSVCVCESKRQAEIRGVRGVAGDDFYRGVAR